MQINRLNTHTVRSRSAGSSSPPSEGFSQLVETPQEEAPQALGQTQPLASPAMLPPMPPSPEAQDREARKHGGALLRALGGLQLAMLGADGGGAAALQGLADLARHAPSAADPALDQVLRAIAQRAAIELARGG